jgi:hypothetical protein
MGNGHEYVNGCWKSIFPNWRRYVFIVGWFFLSSCNERIEASLILIKPDCESGESDPWRSFCI